MNSRRRMTLALAFLVSMICASLPAVGGVHLWRVTEIYSNADGTIQFIELTTCCGSAGGEIFVSGQHVRSNGNDFVFPANLTAATANKHLLLATDGYAALSGVPARDHEIPANFFAIGGDTITFAVYDTMIFAAGALPTNGTDSLQKDEDDISDLAFTATNSPTNLQEQAGTIIPPSPPPAVPDGSGTTTPLTAAPLTPDGSSLRVAYDIASCAGGVSNHHIIYGDRSGFPAGPGGIFVPLGGVCAIGNATPYDWVGVPAPVDSSGLIWFIMVATDASGVEGSWGLDSAGNERRGQGPGESSGICAQTKNVTNVCGQ